MPRGGECLGDLVRREELQRARVDALGVGSYCENEHHVGEIDRLAPRGRSDLGERDIDEEHVTIPDQQVRRLDVSVGEPGIPQFADQVQPVVDDAVVHDRVVDLLRAGEELGDEQVFALGCELHDAVRSRRRDPGVSHEAKCVVLVLDEPAHRLERRFVFQSPIADRTAELVPAVRAHVVHRVELPEQVGVGLARGAQPKRRRAAGLGQPHWLDVDHRDAELILDCATDRLAAATADIEMRGLPSSVRRRERRHSA